MRATSEAYWKSIEPPYSMWYGRPRTAASSAWQGYDVTPWSRPGPYTVCGRRPTLGMPFSSQYTRAVSSLATL